MESDDEAKTVLKKAVKAFRAELEALNAPVPAVEAPVAPAPVDMFVEPDAAAEVESAERDAEVESDVEGTPPKAPPAPSKKATKPKTRKVAREFPDFDDAESQAAADRALRQRNNIDTD